MQGRSTRHNKSGSPDIGKRLREAREQAELTQSGAGKLLDPPVGKTTVSAWESGQNDPPTEHLATIAHHARVSLDWILLGRPGPQAADEYELLSAYRQLEPGQRNAMRTMVEGILGTPLRTAQPKDQLPRLRAPRSPRSKS